MRKALFLLVLTMILVLPCALAQSPYQNSSEESTNFKTYWMGEGPAREYTPSYKLGRGLTNFALGWTEIFMQPRELFYRDRRWPQAILEGAVRGVVFGLGRTAVGVYEVATFPIELPNGFVPILYPETPMPISKDQDRHFYPHAR